MPVETLPRTDEALERLEEAICRCHGDLVEAARSLQTNARYVHIWASADPEVAQRIKAAQMIGWASLEGVLYERAVHGVEEDVYYKGGVVGTKTVRSDALLALMAKARIPGYSENQSHTHTHMVNVNLMPRAASYEDWKAQRERELAPSEEADDTKIIEGTVRELEYMPKVVGYHADPAVPYPPSAVPAGLRDVL